MANVQCNNSIRSLWKKTPFSRRTNEDKLTTKQLGLPRPNISISTKGGKSYIQELERKKIAVVNAVCISYTTVTFHRFHSLFHSSLLALTLNHFLYDDLFCFCKPILSRSVNKYCWFWLMLPLPYDVTGHIMCPVKLRYIIQHLRHVDNKKWDHLMWSHIMFAYEGPWMQLSSIAFHL